MAVEKVNMVRVKLAPPSLQLKYNPAIAKISAVHPATTTISKPSVHVKTSTSLISLTPQTPVSVYSTPIGKEPPTSPAKICDYV